MNKCIGLRDAHTSMLVSAWLVVPKLLLEGLQKDEQVWKDVFSDLADQLHCKEPTVKNRVNTLILDQEINEKLLQLKRAIDLEMPDLIKKHNEERNKTDEAKAARLLQGLSADSTPRIATPQRKFEWTELIRGLLFDVVTKKKKLLSGKKAGNKLKDFFEFEVAVLWPEKWMQIRKLWTTTASVHQLPWPKNALKTPTKRMNIAGTLERQLLRDNPSGRSEEAAVDIAGSSPSPSSSTVYVKQEVADGYKYSTAACISTLMPVTSPTVRVKVDIGVLSTEEFLYNYKAALPGSHRAFQGKVEDLTTEATAYGQEDLTTEATAYGQEDLTTEATA
ncbi:hypothetical protein LSAT2_027054 [Lamellibrachia satsuma]|nr:hypothetical protein LSAT2_027054 [Lamellibrachia satsuma]